MQIFDHLKQAYVIVLADSFEPVYINHAAQNLLVITLGKLKTSVWWQKIKPQVKKSKNLESINIVYNRQHLSISTSAIEQGGISYLAIHFSQSLSSNQDLDYFYGLLDNLGAYVYCKDKNYKYTYANQLVCELFDCQLEDMIGEDDCKFFGEETGRYIQEDCDKDVIEKGIAIKQEEYSYLPRFDEYRHYLSIKKPLRDSDGCLDGLFGISIDITEQKNLQKKNRENEQKLSTILDNAGAYIFIKDQQCRFKYVNRRTAELFQLKNEQIIGKTNEQLLGDIQGEEFSRTDRVVFDTQEKVACIETFETPDKVFYYWTVKIPLKNEKGVIDSFIGISTDITDQKILENELRLANRELNKKVCEITQLKDELHIQASRDVLTGLYNRRYFEQKSTPIFSRREKSFALLMIDVDHFKNVNDSYGHAKGDDVLQFLAQVLKQECRRDDLVCRYGGEEFLVLLTESSTSDALKKADNMRQRFSLLGSQSFPEITSLSISVGVAVALIHGGTFFELYQAADKAMYNAKKQGRNRCLLAG